MYEGRQTSLLRRAIGLSLDWGASLAIVWGYKMAGSFSILAIFFTEVFLLIALSGASFGHRIVGIKVVRFEDGGKPTIIQALIRTLLLCSVIFAITYDENGRGLHERFSGTYLIKTKL